MATITHVLRFTVKDSLEKTSTISFKHVKDPNGSGGDALNDSDVQALATAIVTNGANIWTRAPASVESAEVITTEKTDIALS